MRKLLGWIVVTVGIAALVRKLRGRAKPDGAEPAPTAEDPAEELRQKLATSRDSEGAAEAGHEVDEPAAPEPSSEPTIDTRRVDVHDEGRSAIDEMRKSAEGDSS